jgi:hypothetical protein
MANDVGETAEQLCAACAGQSLAGLQRHAMVSSRLTCFTSL